MSNTFSVTVWNVEWAEPDSERGSFFVRRLLELSSPIICLTEGYSDLLPLSGHIIASESDYGYPLRPGRRKVLLWSREPWREVDTFGSSLLPAGRFVAGTTDTVLGPIRFIGICIPWRDAHVRTGRRDRQPWEDHLTYLQHLPPILKGSYSGPDSAGGAVPSPTPPQTPTIILGDFNQRVPRLRQPQAVFSALADALCGFRFATAGPIAGAPSLSIDHVAVSDTLQPVRVEHQNNYSESGTQMSDHFGLRVYLQSTETTTEYVGT